MISDKNDKDYGGIYCPADKSVHGRSGDAIYPFFYLADKTNNPDYLDAAQKMFQWSERTVSQADGSWLNDPVKGAWKGTTVFYAIAIAEAIKNHGHIADAAFKDELTDRLKKAGDYIYNTFSITYGNINYPIAASYGLSLLGELLDIPKFRTRGRELAHAALPFITQNGILYGEGHPYDQPSPKGCFSVDLGYNVEESLPSLVLYGKLTGDEEVLQAVTRALLAHMEFMLPDGGWDNSWGTRNYKWTYWGSRTSDGCQPAFALMADRDPRFYRVALKNTQLLKHITHKGLLQGGPHYKSHGVPVCVHHTLCHIKALTTILDHERIYPTAADRVLLPRETRYGMRFFSDIQTWLIAKGKFRATVTGYDRNYNQKAMHASGGALTMLWHEATGSLLTASMNKYELIEKYNMQPDTDPLSMPLTPRIEWKNGDETFTNINDTSAIIEADEKTDQVHVKIKAKLVNSKQQDPLSGSLNCQIDYMFTDGRVNIHYRTDRASEGQTTIIFPVISPTGEKVTAADKKIEISKPGATVLVSCNRELQILPTTTGRVFNFVPGMEAVPLGINGGDAEVTISIL